MMNKKDLQNRQKVLFQQLELMNLFEQEFLEQYGKRRYEERINEILDESLLIRKLLTEMEKPS
ncbi:MAG: hypothetical protein AAB316_13895 [Bacteroidota bacterium]